MKIKYIAFDGKEFQTSNECLEYEQSCSQIDSQFAFYDEYNKMIPLNDIQDKELSISGYRFNTPQAAQFIKDTYYIPDLRYEVGVFIWMEENPVLSLEDGFYSTTEIIEQVKQAEKDLQSEE